MTTTVAEYSPTEAALADLRQRYKDVVFEVATTKGMEIARKGRAEIRGYRTALEAKRVEIKAPALERCRLIDAEAKRITAELLALEEPIDALIKAEEQRKERERAEKERIEQERIKKIQDAIAGFASWVASCASNRAAAWIAREIERLEACVIDEKYGEFVEQAEAAKADALAKIQALHAAAVEQEAEQARIKAEREELARLRAEQEKREREERARIETERKQRDEEERQRRAKIEAEERAARERIEAQEREARAKREEEDRIAREKREAEEREARKRQAEEDARLKAERDRIEAERREVEARERKAREEAEAKEREERRLAQELMGGRQLLEDFVSRYGKRKEFAAVAKTIAGWLSKNREPAEASS